MRQGSPLSPTNRRIDIVVLNRHAEEQMLEGVEAAGAQVPDEPVVPESESEQSEPEPAEPAVELPVEPEELQEAAPVDQPASTEPARERRLNLFDNAEPIRRLQQ